MVVGIDDAEDDARGFEVCVVVGVGGEDVFDVSI